ncbi:hypothetical protein WT83_27390 [Burkholderia territorii]|uniref:Uncharacterized protein n=2 Tax=Burkholderia territorii TaxID=1503055 RepID=A0A108E819_9BURK|nr:hypothetical protein WT83_27390 [Burkholderia territorii]
MDEFQPLASDAARHEDAYVVKRLSEALANVYTTLIGDDNVDVDENLNAIERVMRAAQVIRLEVDLYRAQGNAPAEAREQIEAKLRVLMGAVNAYEKATGIGAWYAERVQESCNSLLKLLGSDVRFGLGGENPVSSSSDASKVVAYVRAADLDALSEATPMHPATLYREPRNDERVALYIAPQAGTVASLTEALRLAREELSVVEWENDPPVRVTDLFSKIDSLLNGGDHA